MTDHPTLQPTAAARVRAGEPPGAAPAAAFVDLVCADHELLHAEFDAIIAANFPDVACHGQRPASDAATTTRPRPARRAPACPGRPAVQARAAVVQNLQARQRGPPGVTRGRPGRRNVKDTPRKGGGGIDRHPPHTSEGAQAPARHDHPATRRPRAAPRHL
jgi:hypothetical protein